MSYHHRASQAAVTGDSARGCQSTAEEGVKETTVSRYPTAVYEEGTLVLS